MLLAHSQNNILGIKGLRLHNEECSRCLEMESLHSSRRVFLLPESWIPKPSWSSGTWSPLIWLLQAAVALTGTDSFASTVPWCCSLPPWTLLRESSSHWASPLRLWLHMISEIKLEAQRSCHWEVTFLPNVMLGYYLASYSFLPPYRMYVSMCACVCNC